MIEDVFATWSYYSVHLLSKCICWMHVEGNHSYILFIYFHAGVNDTEIESDVLDNMTGK